MKHIIVTPNEGVDINALLNTIGKINGVKKAEEEKSFTQPGYVLKEEDYNNVVNEAESDEYSDADEVFNRLKEKFDS